MMVLVSELRGVNAWMINEYGAVGGMRLGETEKFWREPAAVPLCPA
jgi:hypothetical protein